MWLIDTETDANPWEYLFMAAITYGVGIWVWIRCNFITAIWAFFMALVGCWFIKLVILQFFLPAGIRAAAVKAVKFFKSGHPGLRFDRVALRANEDDRFIFSIVYSEPRVVSFPPSRKYFAVSKIDPNSICELDREDWWPRGLK